MVISGLALVAVIDINAVTAAEMSRRIDVLFAALTTLVVVYGVEDIASDTLFNTLGGVIVAVGGSGYFQDFAGFARRRFGTRDS